MNEYPFAQAYGEAKKGFIDLSSNENPLGPPPLARKAIEESLDMCSVYPDPFCTSLREKLATRFRIQPECVFIGNGSDEAIEIVLRISQKLIGRPKVILGKPSFAYYRQAVISVGLELVEVPIKDSCYDIDRILKLVDPPCVVIISNPLNPTGTVVTKETLKALTDREGLLLVVDEAYGEFAEHINNKLGRPNMFSSAVGLAENTVVLRTFSKAYGLAGLRIGYAISSKEVIGAMLSIKQPFNVNSLAQIAAISALDDVEHLRKTLENNLETIKLTEEVFSELGIFFVRTWANFILFKEPLGLSQVLSKARILVRDMGGYGLPGMLRVSMGKFDDMIRFLEVMRSSVKSLF